MLAQAGVVNALLQADFDSLSSLTWLHDLPHRIQQHHQQHQQLHGSRLDSEAEDPEDDEWQTGSMQAVPEVCKTCFTVSVAAYYLKPKASPPEQAFC